MKKEQNAEEINIKERREILKIAWKIPVIVALSNSIATAASGGSDCAYYNPQGRCVPRQRY